MQNVAGWRATNVLVGFLLMLEGCAGSPAPRQVYVDSLTSIRLEADTRKSGEHSHPALVRPEEMATILRGVRVIGRKGIIGSLLSGEGDGRPAFSSIEVQQLASQLSRGLEQAKPDELVTFYRRISDADVGLGITSGGMFVRRGRLYLVLANNRTLPTEGLNQNMISHIDPIDSPLLPITRAGFRVSFTPSLAVVPADERDSWPYVDPGRLLVIDLAHIARELRTKSPAATGEASQ